MSQPPDDPSQRFSLSRWSRRKLEAARGKTEAAPDVAPNTPAAPAVSAAAVVAQPPAPPEPLPPVESLTIESDFTKFLAPKVDETVKRAALRKLFSDPHFNVMDGLDTYIGDYTQPDPMPEGMLAKLKDVYETLTKDEEDKPAAEGDAIATAPAPAVAEAAAPPPEGEATNKPTT